MKNFDYYTEKKSFLKDEESIKKWLDIYNENKHFQIEVLANQDERINPDTGLPFKIEYPLLVNVKGDVILRNFNWTPIKFHIIEGDFNSVNTNINDYALPKEVKGHCYIRSNHHYYLPDRIYGDFSLNPSSKSQYLHFPQVDGKIQSEQKNEEIYQKKNDLQKKFDEEYQKISLCLENNTMIVTEDYQLMNLVIRQLIEKEVISLKSFQRYLFDFGTILQDRDIYSYVRGYLDKNFEEKIFLDTLKNDKMQNSLFFDRNTHDLTKFSVNDLEKILLLKFESLNKNRFYQFSFLKHESLYNKDNIHEAIKNIYPKMNEEQKKAIDIQFYHIMPRLETVVSSFNKEDFSLNLIHQYFDMFEYKNVFQMFIDNFPKKSEYTDGYNDQQLEIFFTEMIKHNKQSDKPFWNLEKNPEGPIWYYEQCIKKYNEKKFGFPNYQNVLNNLWNILPYEVKKIKKNGQLYQELDTKKSKYQLFLNLSFLSKLWNLWKTSSPVEIFLNPDKNVQHSKKIVQNQEELDDITGINIQNDEQKNLIQKFRDEQTFFQQVLKKIKPLEHLLSYEEKHFFQHSFYNNFHEILQQFKQDIKSQELALFIKKEFNTDSKYEKLLDLLHEQVISNVTKIIDRSQHLSTSRQNVQETFLSEKNQNMKNYSHGI